MTQVIHMDNIILGHDDYRMYSLCTLIYVQTEEQSILVCFMVSLRFNWISAKLPAQKSIWPMILTTLSKEKHLVPLTRTLIYLLKCIININYLATCALRIHFQLL